MASRCENVAAYADAGVDFVSTSAITQSAPALDIALDLRSQLAAPMLLTHRLREHADRHRSLRRRGARRPLAHRDGRRAHRRRARADDPAVPRVPRLLVRRADRRCRDLVGRPPRDGRAAPDDASATSGSRPSCSSPASAPACRSSTTTRRRSAPTGSPNAVAAYDQYGGPSIVVDFGTANTIEAISEKGEYLGGAIFPGIEISMDALFGRAAALRRVELIAPRNVIGKSTVESIQSGAVSTATAVRSTHSSSGSRPSSASAP